MQSYQSWLDEEYLPIAGGALESNIMGLWFAKQTAKGSPASFTAGTKRGRWVGGDLQANRTDGEETWSDQTLFSDHVDFVNTLVGAGAPVIQGQSSLIAYLCWLSMGQETVTGGTSGVMKLEKGAIAPSAGHWQLQLKVGNTTYKTANLEYNATAAAILSAIVAAFPGKYWSETNFEAEGGPINTTAVKIKAKGEAAHMPMPTLEILHTELTGEITFSQETVGTLYKHVATPSNTGGFYYGIFKEVGKSVTYRAAFNDCRTQSLRIEGSSASKVVKITPTVISLTPGVIGSAEPTKKDDGLKPFLYTEAYGALEVDGVAYHGLSAFALLMTWGLNEYYGDDVRPYDLINNVATASLEGLTLLIDQKGLERYNEQFYGAPVPAASAEPIRYLPFNGSYKATFSRTNPFTGATTEKLMVEVPGVKWVPTYNIPGNPAGGPVELAFTGQMRKTPGGAYSKLTEEEPPFRVTVEEPLDAAFTE